MYRWSLGSALIASAWLAGCGSGDDTAAPPPSFGGALPPSTGMTDGTPSSAAPQAEAPGAPAGTTAPRTSTEGTNPDLGLTPTEPPPAATEPPPTDVPEGPAVIFGNGRVLGDDCTLVCADASTDANPQGQTDGWGFERGRSCLTPQSSLALESE